MRLLADENFNNDMLRGLLRIDSQLDVIRVQDTDIYQASDPVVLEWAARENRILLIHDVQTITKYANDRIRAGQAMPGVIEVASDMSIGQAIEEILITLSASTPEELENRIIFIPLN